MRHNLSRSPEYQAYHGMIARCYRKSCHAYKWYGKRGIKVSKSWLKSFLQFYTDMGKRPSKRHSIDRMNNSKGYSKENCKWATMEEQNNNRRNYSKKIQGENNSQSKLTEKEVIQIIENKNKYTVKELASKFSVNIQTIYKIKNNQKWTHIPRQNNGVNQ